MENTSGDGDTATVPAEINRWNWGAFFLTWIWGLGNRTYIAFLAFIPLVGLVMPFVLGAKGSAWAWRNRRWESVEAFRATQKKWALWGAVVFLLIIGLFVGLFFSIMVAMKSTEAYKMSVQALQTNPAAIEILGKPILTGIPTGSIQQSGHRGTANLLFSVEGPKGQGSVFVVATKSMGQWRIKRAVFEAEKTGQRINLLE